MRDHQHSPAKTMKRLRFCRPDLKHALRNVYHSILLQVLLGAIAVLLLPKLGYSLPSNTAGWIAILLGINTWCYLRRYEKALQYSKEILN